MIRTEKIFSDSDIATVAALADEIWHEYFIDIISDEQISYMVSLFLSKEAIRSEIDNDGFVFYLVYNELDKGDKSSPVGFIALKPEDGLFLSKLYLKSGERGKGLGGEMLDFVCGLALGMNTKRVWLTVNKHNTRAIEVYKRKGFNIIREQVSDIGGGFVMDDFVFEKRI